MKILISRTDRIGDVILSLPLAEILKERYPDSEIDFMLRKPMQNLIEHQPYIDRVIPYNTQGMKKNLNTLKNGKFDIAFLLFPTFSLSLLLYLAHIPKRIGTGFRWYSFLLNQRVYEHRHIATKHEVEYNLALLKKIGITASIKKPRLYVNQNEKREARSFLKNIGIDSKNFIVVHPGSGGSTISWPIENYEKFIKLIRNKLGFQVVLSGIKEEYAQVERIKEEYDKNVANIAGKTNLRGLTAIISLARIFIGNSTGPMHIAAAVGTKVVAFFPPSRVNRKTRWGPLSNALIFEPPVPYCSRCIKERCPYYNCLSLITPEEVMKKIQNWAVK